MREERRRRQKCQWIDEEMCCVDPFPFPFAAVALAFLLFLFEGPRVVLLYVARVNVARVGLAVRVSRAKASKMLRE